MNKINSWIKIAIPLFLSIILIGYVLRKVDISSLMDRISSANPFWIILAIIISLLAHLSRAQRWRVLLQPLGYNPRLKNTFMAVMIGYFGNIFIPRGGEVMRCMVLNKLDNIPFNISLGSVIAERAFDFICLIVLIGVSLLLEFDMFELFFKDILFHSSITKEATSNNLLFIGVGILIAGICVIIWFWQKLINFSLFLKIKNFVTGIIQGVLSIKNIEKKGSFLLNTLIIWGGYFLMTYLMFFSLSPTSGLGPVAGLVILIVGGLGMSAPVSGGIGPFHIMVASALQFFYNISKDDGYAYAFVIHTSQTICIILIGGIFSLMVLFSKNTRVRENENIG